MLNDFNEFKHDWWARTARFRNFNNTGNRTNRNSLFKQNVVGWFHQFNVQRKNRHKFTIVSHKEQEKFSVALMDYKNSPLYVQRQTNKLLRLYKNFAKVYMNDILIHFVSLKKYLTHLHTLFEMFRIKRINLVAFKTFLIYFLMILLEQKIDNLDIFTTTKKIVAITSLRFSLNFKNLKIFLRLINWFRSFILRYAQRAQLLQKRKIILIKNIIVVDSTKKRQVIRTQLYELIYKKKTAFRNLQTVFVFFIFLIYFNKTCRLYINLNASKQ